MKLFAKEVVRFLHSCYGAQQNNKLDILKRFVNMKATII